MIDLPGVGALALVGLEWLALGYLSGLEWPVRAPLAPRAALWLLGGAFVVGLAQLLLAVAGVGFASLPLVLVAAAALASLLRIATAGQRPPSAQMPLRLDRRETAGWLLLALLLAAASLRSLLVPEAGWDAFSHWGLKARAFATFGSIVDAATVHEYYPPLVPLLESWLLQHRGSVSIDVAKTVWPLVGSALSIAVGWHLRLALARPWLAPYFACGVLLGTTQLLESFWTGQADLALAAYLTLATLAAWRWQQDGQRGWLAQIVLFGAAAALTKYEGAPRVAIVVGALLLEALLVRCRRIVVPAVVLGAAAAVAYAPWLLFRASHGIAASSEHLSQFQPQALASVVVATLAVLAGVRTGGGVLVAVLGWVLCYRKLLQPRYRLLTLVTLGQLVATFVAFLISDTAPDVQARTSATRLFEQFVPIALFATALWLEQVPPIIRRGR